MYRKLNEKSQEIRLLEIEPGSREETISCKLKHTCLADPFPDSYETISYVWGDTSCRGSIIVDSNVVDVPTSTEKVLRRVRYANFPRIVWIDSVCINQLDLEERASQVQLMAEIYSKTNLNLIYLGETYGGLDDSIICLRAIWEDARLETDNFKLYTRKLYETYGQWRYSDSSMTQHVDWNAYNSYMDSTWFTRLWVVQEAALSPESVCIRGPSELPLTDVLRAACWVTHKFLSVPYGIELNRGVKCAVAISMHADKDFGRHCILYNRGVKAITLGMLVGILKDFDTKDERDYCFGILGLYQKYFGSDLPGILQPNYTAKYSHVHRDITRFVLENAGNLGIVSERYHRPGSWNTPSWVSQFHIKYDTELDHGEVRGSRFSASGEMMLDVPYTHVTGDPNVLSVKGILVGRIAQVGGKVVRQSFVERGVRSVIEWLYTVEALAAGVQPSSPQMKLQMVADILCCGVDGRGNPIRVAQSVELYIAFSTYLRERGEFPGLLSELTPGDTLQVRNAANYWQALCNASFGRQVFITDCGHLGLAPPAAEAGDIVVVLFGADSPLVLRPLDEPKMKYELLSRCYTYGIMYGEAVESWRSSERSTSIFELI